MVTPQKDHKHYSKQAVSFEIEDEDKVEDEDKDEDEDLPLMCNLVKRGSAGKVCCSASARTSFS